MSVVEVGTGPADLYTAASQLLDAANEACAQTTGGGFSRAYVSPGLPPWDCEQLTLHVGGAQLGDTAPLQPPLQPGVREGSDRALRLVAFTITPLRCCVPVVGGQGIKLPSPDKISACAEQVDSDLWAIWNHLASLKRNGLIFPPAKDRVMFFDPAVAVSTSGGVAGWQIQVRVEIPGYPESS